MMKTWYWSVCTVAAKFGSSLISTRPFTSVPNPTSSNQLSGLSTQ